MFQQQQQKEQFYKSNQPQQIFLPPQGQPQGPMMVQHAQHYPEPVLFQVDLPMQHPYYKLQQHPQPFMVQPQGFVMIQHPHPQEPTVFQQQQQMLFHQQQQQHQELIFQQQQQLQQQHAMMFQKLQQQQQPPHKLPEVAAVEQKLPHLPPAVDKQRQEQPRSEVQVSKAKKYHRPTVSLSLPYPVDNDIPSEDESSDEEIPKATRSLSDTVVPTVQVAPRKRSSYASILHSPEAGSPVESMLPRNLKSSPHYQLHTPKDTVISLNPRFQFLQPVTKLEFLHTENLQHSPTAESHIYSQFCLHSKQVLRRNLRCPVLNCSWSIRVCGREELRKHHFKTHLTQGKINKNIHPVAAELIGQLLYKCLVTGCGRYYSRGDSLKKHIKLVHNKPTSRFNKKARIKLLKGDDDQGKRVGSITHSLV